MTIFAWAVSIGISWAVAHYASNHNAGMLWSMLIFVVSSFILGFIVLYMRGSEQ